MRIPLFEQSSVAIRMIYNRRRISRISQQAHAVNWRPELRMQDRLFKYLFEACPGSDTPIKSFQRRIAGHVALYAFQRTASLFDTALIVNQRCQ